MVRAETLHVLFDYRTTNKIYTKSREIGTFFMQKMNRF